MSATVTGTGGEDRSDYTRDESKSIRARSLRLLGSLVHPLRWQVVLAAVVLVVSTALRVAGPALIAYGIDQALPAVLEENDWMPTILVVGVYLVAAIGGAVLIGWYVVVAARLTQAVMIDLRKRIFLHTQRLSLEFHESYTSGRIISRQTSDLDSIRELLDGGLNELVSGVLYGTFTLIALMLLDWQSGVILAVAGHPALPPDALVLHPVAGRVPRVARDQREGDRAVRRDDDRHPRREGVPQGAPQRRGVRPRGGRLPRRQHALHQALRNVRARPHGRVGALAGRGRAVGRHPGRRRARSRSASCSPPCCTCATSSRRCRRWRSS